MTEKPPSPHLWGEIQLEDIERYLAAEDIEYALRLAKLRLDGLRGTLVDIEAAIVQATEIHPDVWREQRDEYVKEIEVLQNILSKYQQ